MEKLIYSAIVTPDGTLLVSRHRHDYKQHKDKNGETYFLDGGTDYIRTSVNKEEAKSIHIFDNDPHEIIREYLERGGRGKGGKQELKYVLLKDIDDDWLEAIIAYEKKHRPNNPYLKHYVNEQNYRRQVKQDTL